MLHVVRYINGGNGEINVTVMLKHSTVEQEILNKIEFFPIKCRIQNAKENFRKYQMALKNDENFWRSVENHSNISPPKMKVWCIPYSR